MEATTTTAAFLACSCCGRGIQDTRDENTAHGQVPYPYDTGFGMCVSCGGDRRARGTSEKAIRRRLGWAGCMFYDARIRTLNEQLTGASLEKFQRMTYAQKVNIIGRMVEGGKMI